MSEQAKNSIKLYKGQDARRIRQLLNFQLCRVVNELMNYYKASDLDDLALKLSRA